MRVLAAIVLLGVAVVAAVLAWGALENLWSDYQDSEASTYVLVGGAWLVLAAAALYVAGRVWRDRPDRQR
jgi:hypothetical protein